MSTAGVLRFSGIFLTPTQDGPVSRTAVQPVKADADRERPRCAKTALIKILALHDYKGVPVPRCSKVYIEEANVTIHVTSHRATHNNRDAQNTISAMMRRVKIDRKSGQASLYIEGDMLDALRCGDDGATANFLRMLNEQAYRGKRSARTTNRELRRERKRAAKGSTRQKTRKRKPVRVHHPARAVA
jgi:hypothetical protein